MGVGLISWLGSQVFIMVVFKEENFGSYKDESGHEFPVKQFTWKNKNDVSVQVLNYGATIRSINIPSKNGTIEDIITGFDSIQGMFNAN